MPSLKLSGKDRQIVLLVYEHRYLDNDLIWRMMDVDQQVSREFNIGKDGRRRPTKYGFSKKALYRRLRVLSQKNVLESYRLHDERSENGRGAPRAVYGIGLKSAPVLWESVGLTAERVRRIVGLNRVKDSFRRHALQVATFRVLVELACRHSDGHVRLLYWQQGISLRDSVYGMNEQGEEQRFSVYPDAMFGLEVRGKGRVNFAVEIDMGTMSIVATGNCTDIRRKLLGFAYYRRARRHKERYFLRKSAEGAVEGLYIQEKGRSLPPTDKLEPLTGFQVLFVAPGKVESDDRVSGRMANMRASVHDLSERLVPATLFWFAAYEHFNLDNPESLFSPVWTTAESPTKPRSLIG